MSTTELIVDALRDCYGSKPWLPGDAAQKTKTKAAFAQAVSKPPAQLKAADLKNVVYQLWEQGIIEIVPPKDRERTFRYKLCEQTTDAPARADESNDEETILNAYEALRDESKFRHVYISEIFAKTGIAIERIHSWASSKARNREFELGQADWSLATESQRDASIKINGTNYLTVGLLT